MHRHRHRRGERPLREATAEFVVTVEAAGTVALTVGAIAGDGTVPAEKTAGFAISGDTGPKAAPP